MQNTVWQRLCSQDLCTDGTTLSLIVLESWNLFNHSSTCHFLSKILATHSDNKTCFTNTTRYKTALNRHFRKQSSELTKTSIVTRSYTDNRDILQSKKKKPPKGDIKLASPCIWLVVSWDLSILAHEPLSAVQGHNLEYSVYNNAQKTIHQVTLQLKGVLFNSIKFTIQ